MLVADYVRSAKRGKNERKGVHKWHPYYAGYSENFVEDILGFMGATAESVVLDPWMGSGTTAIVCQKLGIQSLGNEINPVMVIFSKAKSAKLLNYNLEEIGVGILSEVSSLPSVSITNFNNDGVLQFINNNHLEQLNRLRLAVDKFLESQKDVVKDAELFDCMLAFFYAVLFRCLRSVGHFKNGKNPTWLVKEIPALATKEVDIYELFQQFTNSMTDDLQKTYQDTWIFGHPLPRIIVGDSRQLRFEDESVDFVVTSPPYLTRIDYAVSTKPELLFLGYEENKEFDQVRRATMGAPVICDKTIQPNKDWGEICCSFLERVSNHDTKAARSYYLRVFLQYFKDAYNSLCEIKRVLKPGGQACLVVQSSYFKEVEVKLGEIYVEMGNLLGLDAEIVKREEIRQHIAHVNSKSSQYVKNKVYYEDAVIFRKRSVEMGEYSSHREQVAQVAGLEERAQMLEEALSTAFERHIFIKEVQFINFGNMTAEELAEAFRNYPIIVKPILACVNVAGRAVKRDLDMSLDTYKGKLSAEQSAILAGYIKPMLPNELAIPALCELDRWFFVDKEIRKNKGSWEKTVLKALNVNSLVEFKKRKFTCGTDEYELDAASPVEGTIEVGIDVKRIESKRDIHKRADEIINKAGKFKAVFPDGKFFAVVYYPFPADHLSLKTRLDDKHIDGIYFAGESYSSIEQQAKYILGEAKLLNDEESIPPED